MRISAKPALSLRPAESTHGLGWVAEIIHEIQAKTQLGEPNLEAGEVDNGMDPGGDRSQTDDPTCCEDGEKAKGDLGPARRKWRRSHRSGLARF